MSVSWTKLKLPARNKAKEGEPPPKDDLAAADIVAYLADAQAGGDYYSEGNQAVMMWHTTARAAGELGIVAEAGQPYWRQPVRRATLEDLLAGRNPRTGEVFRRAGGDGTRVAAIDVTMSPAPKSVSILWALGSKELRKELELMVAKASDRAMMRMLEEQPFLRRFVDGTLEHHRAQDYIAVSAVHTTARMSAKRRGVPDPQLHLHYLLIGALDDSGWMRALDSKTLADYQAELSAEASGHLAEMLRQRGFEIERRLEYRKDKKGTERPRVFWEVAGVPKSLIEAMSSRTMEIAELKQRFMKEYGREPVGRAWDAWIVKQRGPKAKLTSLELLLAWVAEGEEHGFGPEVVRSLATTADLRRAMGVPDRDKESPEAQQFRELVMAHVCREHAFVDMADLFSMAHQLAVGLIPPRQVGRNLIRMIEDYDLLVTMPDRKVTTLEVLRWEKRAMDGVRRLLATSPLPGVPSEVVEAEIERRTAEGKPFDEHQAEAVRVAVSGARFVSITGPAGTGKGVASRSISTLFRESAILVLQQAGSRVIALAVPGRTAQQAAVDAEADLAMTINSLEFRVGVGNLQLSEHDVLLVDEAGMIDHSRYAALLEAASSAGAAVVQVGDDKQLAPVGPGGLWTSTHHLAEAAGTAAELRVVRRALDPATAEAWTDLAHGRVTKALTYFRDIGLLRLYDTRAELREAMVAEWWEADPEQRDGLMIVDTSNEERDLLNRLAQEKRLEAGRIGSEALQFEVEGRELHVGDKVLFTAIHRPETAEGRRVKRVENGTPALVTAIDMQGQRVQLELDEPVKVEGEQPPKRRLWVGKDVPVELGYARHVMKAQGVTTDTADIAVALRTHLNELYVMVSRAREGARIHALGVEVEELAEEEAELRAELEADRAQQLELEGLDTQPAEERAQKAAELLTKQQDATIAEIERRATPSTKEAVGDRPIGQAQQTAPGLDAEEDQRDVALVRQDLKRDDLMVPQLATLPVPTPEPDLASVQLADGQVLTRGDVVRVEDPTSLPGRAGEEVRPGDLGVVLGCHRGGITWNYATAQLVGGRQVELWQTAEGVEVQPDLPPSVVQEAVPRPDQRDPASLGVLELQNGARLMRGDLVQLTQPARLEGVGLLETGTHAWVDDIERHQRNRAVVQLEDGRRASVYSAAPLAIVQPVEEARLGPGAEPPAPDTERSTEPVEVLPASDPRETLARQYLAAPDTARALGHLQIAGRLEYAEQPMARAIERLAEDREAVLVVSHGQHGRALTELGKQPELEADVRERGRLVLADDAYQQRREQQAHLGVQQREGQETERDLEAEPEAGRLEGVPIGRAIVVAEEPWATPELARAMSVASESHLVSRSLGLLMQEKVQVVIEQHHQADQAAPSSEPNRAAEARARELAHEHSLERDLSATPEHSAERGSAEVEHSGPELER